MKPRRIVYFDFRPGQPVITILRIPGPRRDYARVSLASFDRLVRVCTVGRRFRTRRDGLNRYAAHER